MSKTETLVSFKEKILDALFTETHSSWTAARLAIQAKAIFFAGHGQGKQWEDWCRDDLGAGRRTIYRWQSAVEFEARVREGAADLVDILRFPESKVPRVALLICAAEQLSRLNLHQLRSLLTKIGDDLHTMDRDDLRQMVNKALGIKTGEDDHRQMDFFQRLNLPSPEDILIQVRENVNRIDPDKSGSYGFVFLSHAVTRKNDLTPDQRQHLTENLCKAVEAMIDNKVNIHAIVKPFSK